MTALLTTTATRFRTVGAGTIVSIIAMTAAVAAVAADAPLVLRIPAFVVLLAVPGFGIVRLLLGDEPCSARDSAIRTPLAILLGLLGWLGVALAMNSVGIRLGPTALAIGIGGLGVVLALVTTTPRRPRSERRSLHLVSMQATPVLDAFLAVAATAVVLALATWAAGAMVTKAAERYTTLALTDSKPYAGDTAVIQRGNVIRLNWVLRGFGCRPSPTLTSVRVVIDGAAVDDVAVDLAPRDDSTDVTTLVGAATFAVSSVTGGHLVELSVLPAAADGTPLPAPGYVSTFVEVDK